MFAWSAAAFLACGLCFSASLPGDPPPTRGFAIPSIRRGGGSPGDLGHMDTFLLLEEGPELGQLEPWESSASCSVGRQHVPRNVGTQ